MKDGRCIVRVSLDMLNVIIRRPRIVTVIYGYFIRLEVFLSFLFPPEPVFYTVFPLSGAFFLWRLVRFERVASRIHSAAASLILKIGGQWRVNLRETHTRTVKDSKRSPGQSALFTDERCENWPPDVYSPLLLVSSDLQCFPDVIPARRNPWSISLRSQPVVFLAVTLSPVKPDYPVVSTRMYVCKRASQSVNYRSFYNSFIIL